MTSKRPDESKLYKQLSVSTEIHLRHLSIKVGLARLADYLNRAAKAGIIRVTIIHGRSGGDLKKAVHEHLKNNKLVKSYEYPALPSEGGPGATIARLHKITD
tara:strand:+ start:1742 stop:2047 length:306 start_codon:yes stop_codon:yes gene_type:complete